MREYVLTIDSHIDSGSEVGHGVLGIADIGASMVRLGTGDKEGAVRELGGTRCDQVHPTVRLRS